MGGDEATKDNEEVLALYQMSADDIRFAKQQAWQAAYYLLAIDAALVWVTQGLKATWDSRLLLVGLAAVATIATTWFVVKCQIDMTTYRDRIKRARKKLSEKAQNVLNVNQDDDDPKDRLTRIV